MKKLLLLALLLFPASLCASNLQISGGRVSNFLSNAVELSFTVSQENTISTNTAQSNPEQVKDCAWIFVKYSVNGDAGPWYHATISSASAGDAPAAAIVSPADHRGVYLYANENKSYWTSNNVKVRWNFLADGVTTLPSQIHFRIMGIEMVYIAQGSFIYNAGGIGGSTANNFGNGDEYTVYFVGNVPAGSYDWNWPNGFRAFYCAKHEISQKQYVDFLNCVDPAGTSANTYYDSSLYNTYEYYIKLDLLRPAGNRYYVTGGHESLSCNFLNWEDCCRYASWCGLRPMTEMEFERAARGCNDTATYPWGETNPMLAVNNSTETKTGTSYDCWKYYANFNDNLNNLQNCDGPTPAGHYLSGLNVSGVSIPRTTAQTGASRYGITDLAGNNSEHVINCQWPATPANGNGTITCPVSWPSSAATGVGTRGGAWSSNSATLLRISDRSEAANTDTYRENNYGFRPVRTP